MLTASNEVRKQCHSKNFASLQAGAKRTLRAHPRRTLLYRKRHLLILLSRLQYSHNFGTAKTFMSFIRVMSNIRGNNYYRTKEARPSTQQRLVRRLNKLTIKLLYEEASPLLPCIVGCQFQVLSLPYSTKTVSPQFASNWYDFTAIRTCNI